MDNIIDYLSKVPDKRRKQGIRYALDKTLALMLIGTMAGCVGYRSIARFCKDHEKLLSKAFDLKHGVPSHVSLIAIVTSVDLEDFQKAVNEWSKSKLKGTKKGGSVIAIDGKAIKASVNEGTSKEQNFISFVHAFCVSEQIVIGSLAFENKKLSETEVVRTMIEMLGMKGAIFTLDANHDSKKH